MTVLRSLLPSPAVLTDALGQTRRRSLPGWRSLLLYIGLMLLLDRHAVPDPAHRLFDPWNDPSQTTWFFSYVANSVVHGRNPLVTDYLQYPTGINLMWNAAMPLLGLIALPVTLTLGPVLSYHLLLVLGMAATGWTTRLWLGRHVSAPAAVVGGLIFAFSPYAVGQAIYHVGQSILPFVPLMLMLLEDLLWRRPRRQWISGALLGLCVAGQALINEETALIALIGILVVAVVAVILRPVRSVRMLRGTLLGWVGAAAGFLVAFGAPLWVQFRGPNRFSSLLTNIYVAEPKDFVLPTPHVWLDWTTRDVEFTNRGLGQHEVGGYLGFPLLVLLVVAVIVLRRRFDMWLALLSAVGLTVLSLGSQLRLGTDLVGPPLPGWVLTKLPVVRNILPVRFSMASWLAVAFLVALILDAALHWFAQRRQVLPAVGSVAVLACLVPLIPSPLPSGNHTDVPAYFTGAAIKSLKPGTAVLVLPFAQSSRARPLLWMAESGTRLKLIGGAAKHPGPGGMAAADPPGTPLTHWSRDVTNGDAPRPLETKRARQWMNDNHVGAVLMVRAYFGPEEVKWVNDLMGRDPDRTVGGVSEWTVRSP